MYGDIQYTEFIAAGRRELDPSNDAHTTFCFRSAERTRIVEGCAEKESQVPPPHPPAFARYSVHTCVILRTIRVRENRIGKYAASSFIISY